VSTLERTKKEKTGIVHCQPPKLKIKKAKINVARLPLILRNFTFNEIMAINRERKNPWKN
jgi:hypothetical protein